MHGLQANLPHAPSWAAQAPAALATPTHSHPASRSQLKGPSSATPTSASEMAANLAASPWASWFMDNSEGHPPEAGVVHLPHGPGLASDTQPSHMADAALNQAAWWADAAQAPGGLQQDHQPQPQLPMWLDIPASAMQQQQQQPGRPHEPGRQAEPQADQLAQQLQGAGLGGQHQALAWEVPVSELRWPSTASQPPSREGRGAGKGARQPGGPLLGQCTRTPLGTHLKQCTSSLLLACGWMDGGESLSQGSSTGYGPHWVRPANSHVSQH